MKTEKLIRFFQREFIWLFLRLFPLVVGYFILYKFLLYEFLPYEIYSILTKVLVVGYILFAAAAVNRYLLGSFETSIGGLIKRYSGEEDKRKKLIVTSSITRIFKYAIYLIAFLLCINLFMDLKIVWNAIGSTFFLLISFFIGLLTSSVLGNIIAYEALRQSDILSKNDVIETKDDLFGTVVSRGPFFTRVRTPNKEIVSISNLDLTNNLVKNYSKDLPIIINALVGLGYDVKKNIAKNLLLEAARKTEGVLKSPKPYVLFIELGEFSITYKLMAYIDQPRKLINIRSHLIENIIDTFNENNVEILSPQYYTLAKK